MITEVIVVRKLMGCDISQKSKSEFLSATDLIRAGNKYRIINNLPLFDINEYLRRKSTIEFVNNLKERYGNIKISSKGKSSHTWVHPYLFIDIALTINTELKIEVYEWLFDHLLKYRNDSGDSYKKMAGALYNNHSNKSEFAKYIVQVADKIKTSCSVNDWNTASEAQLKLRDKIHESIYLLSDVLRDNDKTVDIAIIKSLKH